MRHLVFRLLGIAAVIAMVLPVSGLAAQGPARSASGDANGNSVYLPMVVKLPPPPAGEFRIGCDPARGGYPCYSSELPLHTVYQDQVPPPPDWSAKAGSSLMAAS